MGVRSYQACCTKMFAQTFWMSTVSIARPDRPPITADGKRVRITIGNGPRAEVICGELVSESANWIIRQ